MPSSPFEAAGAQKQPSEYAPLLTNRFPTGLWTQRNRLRDAATPYLYEKFYSATRFDSLIGGSNFECSSKLTLMRRPGHSVYNSQTFPAIRRYYDFKTVEGGVPRIRVMADCDNYVYDATGPNTKTLIYTKSAGAGRTSFRGLGNTLYMVNGVDAWKWTIPAQVWSAATSFTQGQFVLDPNNNLQLAIGAQTMTVDYAQISNGLLYLFFDPSTPMTDIPIGAGVTFSGLTGPFAVFNGITAPIVSTPNSLQATFGTGLGDVAYQACSGSVTTGTGISGNAAPAWSSTLGGITYDGTLQWVCRGSSVQKMGIAAPLSAPGVTQVAAPSLYPTWAPNTWYAPLLVIIDSNGNIQQLTTPGTLGGAAPAWNATIGGTTTDNTAVWTNMGSATRAVSTNYAAGAIIAVSWTYYITITVPVGTGGQTRQEQVPVNQSAFFKCVTAGESSAQATAVIQWTNGLGTQVSDGSVVWQNIGGQATWASYGAGAVLSDATTILDSNGNTQAIQNPGKSGATAPTWATAQGSLTTDGSATWSNTGSFSSANTEPWIYAYSFGNDISAGVSTASAQSVPITPALGNQVVLQGTGSPDTQCTTIWIWRTDQGGSVLLLLDQIPNPGNKAWIYTDTTPDSGLDALITAPIANTNNPPPLGLTNLAYHAGRLWGSVNSTAYYCTGPDVTTGNGFESWAPANNFTLSDNIVRYWPTTVGLVVMTTSGSELIPGLGDEASPFQSPQDFLAGIGLASWDLFCVQGSTAYAMMPNGQVVSFGTTTGIEEVGFPIGDQFTSLYMQNNVASGYMTWHQGSTSDMGLFVADGAVGWFKMLITPAPESGYTWCTRGEVVGGAGAVASLETTPGVRQLLVGPTISGPILFRDPTVWEDAGSPYTCTAEIGSIMLAEQGQIAEVVFVAVDSSLLGSHPTVGVLLGEISGEFEVLTKRTQDPPPPMPKADTLYNDRFYLRGNQQPVLCRHMQLSIGFPAEGYGNEVLTYAINGAVRSERVAA